MTHRTVEITWFPRTTAEWVTFTTARAEAARLWAAMVTRHARIRRLGWKWPTRARWDKWARGKFPGIGSQSVQQVIGEFLETVSAMTAKRKSEAASGTEVTARYPWRTKAKYRSVPYTNQCANVRGDVLVLSNGRHSTPLRIPLPADRPLPGRLMEASLAYGIVRLVCKIVDSDVIADGPTVGIDLGINTLAAATDGQTAVLVNGRALKAIVQYRNKTNAAMCSRIDRCKRGSRRRKKLARAKRRSEAKTARKVKDILHKATRVIANAFPRSAAVVGKPFNAAARVVGRVRAQQISQAPNAKLIAQFAYKMAGGAESKPEPYSSQTCPGCGCRQKCRRVYQCKECGWSAPRDVVGALNIRSIGLHGEIRAGLAPPTDVRWVRPLRKYPVASQEAAGSSGGTPARVAA